jgi:hypothetical protein
MRITNAQADELPTKELATEMNEPGSTKMDALPKEPERFPEPDPPNVEDGQRGVLVLPIDQPLSQHELDEVLDEAAPSRETSYRKATSAGSSPRTPR